MLLRPFRMCARLVIVDVRKRISSRRIGCVNEMTARGTAATGTDITRRHQQRDIARRARARRARARRARPRRARARVGALAVARAPGQAALARRGRQGRRRRWRPVRRGHPRAVDLARRPRGHRCRASRGRRALLGSIALLGDTLHNAADALTAVPLGIAFVLGPGPRTGATPTGTGGPRTSPVIVDRRVIIAASSALAAYEAIQPPAAPAARRRPVRGGRRGADRVRGQRARRQVPHPGRPPDRLGRAGGRRAARAHRRVHLAGRAARRGRRRARLGTGPTR